MKNIKKKSLLKNIIPVSLLTIFLISTFCLVAIFTTEVSAKRRKYTANTDDGISQFRPCKSGNCFDYVSNGAFWLEIPMNGKTRTIYSVLTGGGTGPVGLDLRGGDVISGCKTTVYILVTRLSGGGLAGPVDIDFATKRDSRDKGYIPKGATIRTEKEASSKFKEHEKEYWEQHQQRYKGTHTGWFCADPGDTTTTTTTTKFDPVCMARAEREWGDTRSNISVRNASLDGDSWSAKGPRQGLPTSSGWTDEGGTYWTIAKPGDGIQFQHQYCAGDRYVRRTSTQGAWTGDEYHTEKFSIHTNKFKIGANVDSYIFGSGLFWVNEVGKSIDKYENLFDKSGKPNGVDITDNGYGISFTSPTSDNKEYDCSSIAQYKKKDPYIENTYQVPGFDDGECKSSKKTGVSNPVGSTITQWHEFNSVKAWEQYTHDRSGSCGCEVGDAWFGGSSYSGDYDKPRSEWGNRKTWACDPPSKSCKWSCDSCCDVYGNCNYGSYKSYSWPYKSGSFDRMYMSTSKDYGTKRKTAHVYIPYNYQTTTHSNIIDKDTVFQGSTVGSSFKWAVIPRENDKLSNFDYATVTPPNTQVQMVEFLYPPDNQSVEGKEYSRENPEAFFKAKGAIVTNAQTIASGNQNPKGKYNGKKSSKVVNSIVPDNDEWIGYKYCVAVGIFPSDSHDDVNGENNSLKMQYTYGAGAMDAGSYWNISGATCRTIAKKPSFEVWNGSIYTNNGINTSLSQKVVNAKLGSDIDAPDDLFGSWADYAIISGKKMNGMASGAMFGFNNRRYNLSGNKGQPNDDTYSSEKLNPETIANKNGETGNSNINANTSINMNLERLRSRYSEKARNMAFNETHTNSQPTIVSSKTGMQFVYFDGNLKTSELGIRNVANGINQTTSRNSNKDLIKGLGDGKNDNTLVIYVRGNLVIDNNICLGEGCLGNGMQLVDYRFNRKTNSAAKLPQVLIFADNINITENVTRVDAWLVANNTLNTCAGYDPNSVVAKDAFNRYSEGVCYKTLMVNGPVYASELILPRTAGATHGYSPTDSSNVLYRRYGATGENSDSILGSGTPAEIFNLRADAYLWAYNQAQRYSEAIVTYKRELAPRY